MHAEAEGSSPPPLDFTPNNDSQIPIYANATALQQHNVSASSRKRKRAPVAASSPAPSDQASNAGNNANPLDLLATSRADLSTRPILTISRGPTFIPTAEGSEWFKTEMIGVNRVGYRYVPAGINPPGHATACRTIESNPTSLRVSWEDRSPFLKVTKDGLSIAGSKGFRSARCNAPIREGQWYMEVKILQGGGEHVGEESRREGSHVRLGWGRREAPLNAPVGLDGYSYGLRDKTGDKVTLSRPRPYGKPISSGDVVGMYISLPPRRPPNKNDPLDPANLKRERIPIDLKGQEVFEILEYPQSKEMAALMDYSGKTTSSASVPSANKKSANGKLPERTGAAAPGSKSNNLNLRPLPILPGSRIAFFVNGEAQGLAFEDIYDYLPLRQTDAQKANSRKRTREGVKEHRENPFDDGTLGYYPFISLFNEASVRLNPGPDFDFPPPDDIDAVLDGQASGIDGLSATTMNIDSSTTQPTFDVPFESDTKPIIDPKTSASDGTATSAPAGLVQPKRTWRPASERYPEFMKEEWAFDALEDEEAKVELAKLAAADKVEEDKRKQREKRRLQAEARRQAEAKRKADEKEKERLRRAKAAEAKAQKLSAGTDVELELALAASMSSYTYSQERNQPSPSPLRHFTAYEPEGSAEDDRSPVPTPQGAQSGYTSENHDHDMDVDQDIEALIEPDTHA